MLQALPGSMIIGNIMYHFGFGKGAIIMAIIAKIPPINKVNEVDPFCEIVLKRYQKLLPIINIAMIPNINV